MTGAAVFVTAAISGLLGFGLVLLGVLGLVSLPPSRGWGFSTEHRICIVILGFGFALLLVALAAAGGG